IDSANAWARVWDTSTGLPVSPDLRHPTKIYNACLNPSGWLLATACADGKVRIWETNSGKLAAPLLHHAGEVRHVAFSRDGNQLLTASGDKTVRVWDLTATGLAFAPSIGKPPRPMGGRLLAFSPDSRRLLTAGFEPYPARIWELGTKRALDLKHGS